MLVCRASDRPVIRGTWHSHKRHFNNLANEPPTRVTIDGVDGLLPLKALQSFQCPLTQNEEESLLTVKQSKVARGRGQYLHCRSEAACPISCVYLRE